MRTLASVASRRVARWSGAVCLPLTLLALLASCAGDGSTLDPAGRPLGPPEIRVDPADVSLSLLEKTSLTVEVTVTNAGGLPLVVERVTSEQAFIRPQFEGVAELRMDESRRVRLEITAGEATSSPLEGTVEIASNDSAEPTATVAIHLEITPTPVPEIDVSPAVLDLTLAEGESEVRNLRISNLGSADLVVSDVSSTSTFLFPTNAPTVVPSADSANVSVTVSADGLIPGFHFGTIDVTSNDEDEPVVQVPVDLEVTHAGPFPATLSAIQANVFNPSCAAVSWCHGSGMQMNLDLRDGNSFDSLVGRPSLEVDALRVDPFHPDDSYLVCKVENCAWIVGNQMPAGELPLDPSVVEVIRRWIALGAQDD